LEHSPGFLKLAAGAKARVRQTSVQTVRERLSRGERFLLIDVREDHEWAKGRLPGALHLGRGILERDIEKAVPDKDADIVLYCGGGFRSALAAESLGLMGYTRVASMDGGYRGWESAGGEIQR
jgi:rhodanese-related sulfurtransferase